MLGPYSYWGQNSYGATHLDDPANYQKRLSFYCQVIACPFDLYYPMFIQIQYVQDDVIDVIPIAFINKFAGTGGKPVLELANVRPPKPTAAP